MCFDFPSLSGLVVSDLQITKELLPYYDKSCRWNLGMFQLQLIRKRS